VCVAARRTPSHRRLEPGLTEAAAVGEDSIHGGWRRQHPWRRLLGVAAGWGEASGLLQCVHATTVRRVVFGPGSNAAAVSPGVGTRPPARCAKCAQCCLLPRRRSNTCSVEHAHARGALCRVPSQRRKVASASSASRTVGHALQGVRHCCRRGTCVLNLQRWGGAGWVCTIAGRGGLTNPSLCHSCG
jgi:hypothetical protein